MPSGVDELCDEFRGRRDGRDCNFNVIVNIAEARGLNGKGGTGLNDCRARVFGLWDPDGYELSCKHDKTSTPFFGFVAKLTYEGQPRAFFESVLVIEIVHDRSFLPAKPIGQIQVGIVDIFLCRDHKIPMQWLAISDVYSDEPAIPTGYIRCSLIINSQDEPGAVQPDVPEEERSRCELLQIPRIHMKTATGVYNLIFKVYQAINLNASSLGYVDPAIKIETSLVSNATDIQHSQNPVFNQRLQIPVYEPHFRQMIGVQLMDNETVTAGFCLSWKDIYSAQEYYNKARWYDFYAIRQKTGVKHVVETTGAFLKKSSRTVGHILKDRGLASWGDNVDRFNKVIRLTSGSFEEATEYCGRVLMSVEIEDREGMDGAPPSIALTDMKPKECKLFQDIKQKMFFRFHVFAAQGLNASKAQVTLTIGRKILATKPVARARNGMFEFSFFEAMEMEDDYAYDDTMWPWHDHDYEEGYFPSDLIDLAVPVCWLNVYKCGAVSSAVGLGDLTKTLIGFKKMTLRELLGIGPREREATSDLECGKPIFAEQVINDNEKSNVIFNMQENSQPSFFVPAAEQPSKSFDCREPKEFRPDPSNPPWPHTKDDGRGNFHPLDPYRGMQCVELDRDGTCDMGPEDFAGFVWVSLKMYVPSRSNCKNPHKGGPPILSPFTKYNHIPIPPPEKLKCTDIFGLRVQVFQAKDLPSENKSGIANAYVQVLFMGKEMSTRTVYGSNSPTWDEALMGSKFNNLELPCLGWPGECGEYPTDPLDYKYNPKDEDWDEQPDTDEYAERWVKNYNMLRVAPRIEVRVMENVGGVPVMLGRCHVRPEECYHTQCDPSWRELFKGNPEMDEGMIYFSMQLVHNKDPIYKAPPQELAPQRISGDQLAMAIDNEIPDIETFVRSMWSAEGGFTETVDGATVPYAFFNRHLMPCAGISAPALLGAAEVVMRECKVQVQILGLRNMSRRLKLSSPSLHVFIQTSEQWDADEKSYQFTKDKSLPSPYEVNFQEQIELEVMLPDDAEYAPNLEFVVMDKGDFWSFESQTVVCWGTFPLRDLYPCGEKPDEGGEEEEEEDAATAARREKAEKKQQFEDIVATLQRRGVLNPKQASKLNDTFKAQQGKGMEIEQAFDFYMAAPSDGAFIARTEDWLSVAEKAALLEKRKKMEKEKEKAVEKKAKDRKKEEEKDKKVKDKEKTRLDKEEKDRQEKIRKANNAAEEAAKKEAAVLLKKEEDARKQEVKRQAAEAKKKQQEEDKAKKKEGKASLSLAPADGPGAVAAKVAQGENGGTGKCKEVGEESGEPRTNGEKSEGGSVRGSEEGEEGEADALDSADAGAYDSADAPADENDTEGGTDTEPAPGAGPDAGEGGAGEAVAGAGDVGAAEDVEEAECPGSEDEMRLSGEGLDAGETYTGDADQGPAERFRENGDDPRLAGMGPAATAPTDEQHGDTPGDDSALGAAGSRAGAGGGNDTGGNLMAILPQDDEEPDRQEVVDTPDGKPSAEWLVLRKFPSFMEPLEKTEDWGPCFEPSFHEIALYQGRIRDYKRREAEQVGMVKCKIKIFRKEDETLAGMAKADNSRPPDYYEVDQDDASIADALEHMRPYRVYNIYELYPESTVEVRAYCLKAFQVTPGGFMREESEELIFFHYLQAELGDEVAMSNAVKSLNPNFFFVFQFKRCILPGPSQLTIKLMDGIFGGIGNALQDFRPIGETVIDLEDRWFCQDWCQVRHKPREVRDLINEEKNPGVSQGKLSLFIDIVDQNKADENPIEDIQVLGKTLTMETRVIIWNTRDTAPKDRYTSDVYVMCELIGCGQPKMTDTHPSVKIKAYGMFNFRLKWRCKYPDMNLEYLMRIGVWDENTMTSHQAIGEGVLPLRKIFKDCFERNQGKTSPDEMEFVFLLPEDVNEDADPEKQIYVDDDNNKYPYVNMNLVHPNFGFNPAKDAQAKLEISVQVMPRAKAKAGPAGKGRYGPSRLPEPGRPPQPANPIFEPEKCKAYISYTISETFNSCRTPCICLCCILCVVAVIGILAGIQMSGMAPLLLPFMPAAR